jgi:hypothetical protein
MFSTTCKVCASTGVDMEQVMLHLARYLTKLRQVSVQNAIASHAAKLQSQFVS